MSLTITHSPAEGTLIEGTSRGDGTAEILKTNGWRWSRQLGAWYVPQSRDHAPRTWVLDATAKALRTAGFDVEVTISTERRDIEEIEADKAERSARRADRLQERADKHHQVAGRLHDRADAMASRIPLGQPILIGHHSETRDRRYRGRIQDTFRKAYDEQTAGDADQRAAQAAAAHQRGRYSAITVANRIERLEAELRAAERIGATGQAARLTEELDYWRNVRVGQIERGEAVVYDATSVRPGDYVRAGSSWYLVVRSNKRTVSVQMDRITNTLPYHHIQGHRPQ